MFVYHALHPPPQEERREEQRIAPVPAMTPRPKKRGSFKKLMKAGRAMARRLSGRRMLGGSSSANPSAD